MLLNALIDQDLNGNMCAIAQVYEIRSCLLSVYTTPKFACIIVVNSIG